MGRVFISPQAYSEFAESPFLTDAQKISHKGIIIANGITLAPVPSASTVAQFTTIPNTPFSDGAGNPKGDAFVLASASDHKRALILSDKRAFNGYIQNRRSYPAVKFALFITLSPFGPVLEPTMFNLQ